jgi:hypothetical protein
MFGIVFLIVLQMRVLAGGLKRMVMTLFRAHNTTKSLMNGVVIAPASNPMIAQGLVMSSRARIHSSKI